MEFKRFFLLVGLGIGFFLSSEKVESVEDVFGVQTETFFPFDLGEDDEDSFFGQEKQSLESLERALREDDVLVESVNSVHVNFSSKSLPEKPCYL